MSETKKDKQFYKNFGLALVLGQVGLVTIGIIIAALFGGLFLDKYFDTRPFFTLILMIASMPVTLYVMFRVVQGASKKINNVVETKQHENLEGGS